jgi:RNA polymerase sigma-70 factor (ECF subfamily)
VRTGDEEDVERVLSGDIEAFENIVRRWQGPLVNLAYRFCRDRSRAEDMAQEAFLRAYRALGSWRKEAAFSTWLFALATNLYRSELRRIPQRTVSLDEAVQLANLKSANPEPDAADRERAVRQAVSSLPAKFRDALVLFYFHDMDVSSAAKSLDLAEGTLKARLSRARELLRRKLPSFGESGMKEAE